MNSTAVISSIAALLLAGAFAVVGGLGAAGKLPPNRWAGIRTAATMRSEDAFVAAHRAAGPGLLAAGIVAALGGIVGIAAGGGVGIAAACVTIVVALVVAGWVSGLGIRAAEAVRQPSACDSSGGCGGCALAGACGSADTAVG